MKKILLICVLLSSKVFAWTLVYKGAEGYPSPKITIDISSTNCTNADLTAAEIKEVVQEAIDMYWNSVPTSSIELKVGTIKSISIDGDTSTSAVAAKASANSILIGCNDDVTTFTDGFTGAVGGISCSGSTCRGGVIINDHSSTKVDTYSKIQLQALLGHEIGHAIGLGHSSVEEALMHYSVGYAQESLHQDDMNGITWLYPNEDELGGLAGSCGTITFDQGDKNLSLFAVLMLMLMTFIAIEFGRRLRLGLISEK